MQKNLQPFLLRLFEILDKKQTNWQQFVVFSKMCQQKV